ncbi:MAG: 37S ribosomal protein S9, mitochondrial, partial [Marteilia pararefringens]
MLRRLFGARKVPLISSLRSAANCRLFSTNESAPQRNDRTAQDSPFQISAAMNLFLQTHRKNQQFLQSRKAEYERGKEYLAKMMDLDKSCLDKEAIQTAIDYLFPS